MPIVLQTSKHIRSCCAPPPSKVTLWPYVVYLNSLKSCVAVRSRHSSRWHRGAAKTVRRTLISSCTHCSPGSQRWFLFSTEPAAHFCCCSWFHALRAQRRVLIGLPVILKAGQPPPITERSLEAAVGKRDQQTRQSFHAQSHRVHFLMLNLLTRLHALMHWLAATWLADLDICINTQMYLMKWPLRVCSSDHFVHGTKLSCRPRCTAWYCSEEVGGLSALNVWLLPSLDEPAQRDSRRHGALFRFLSVWLSFFYCPLFIDVESAECLTTSLQTFLLSDCSADSACWIRGPVGALRLAIQSSVFLFFSPTCAFSCFFLKYSNTLVPYLLM